ncbi:MAG: glycosyltransferase [Acidimicrobiales bacterium]|nr:glycosyltransferase [Acidimicrobiales bacterium]
MDPSPRRLVVAFVHDVVPHYRVPLFNALNEALDGGLTVVSERPPTDSHHVDGTGDLEASFVPTRRFRLDGVWFTPRSLWFAVRGRCDVMVLHWYARHLEVLPILLIAKARGVPVLLYGHGLGRSRSRVVRLLRRMQLSLSAGAIVYSRGGADRVRTLGVDREVHVIDNTTGRPPPGPGDVRSEPGRRLVYIGRLQGRKRVDRLIDALALLGERGLELSLTVVGNGPERARLVARADRSGVGGRIEWVGTVTDWGVLRPMVAEADFVVIPEHAGLAVVDALSCARPVITADTSDHPPEAGFVIHGETGLVYSPASVDGLARCIEEAYEQPDLIERLSMRAGELYRDRLTLERAVERFMGVLTGAAGGTGRRWPDRRPGP